MYMMFFGSSVLLLIGMAVLWSVFLFRGRRWLTLLNIFFLLAWLGLALVATWSIGWEFIRQIFGMLAPMVVSPFILLVTVRDRSVWGQLVKRYAVFVSWFAVYMITFQIPAFPDGWTYFECFGLPILVFILLYAWDKWFGRRFYRHWIVIGSVLMILGFIFISLLWNAKAMQDEGHAMQGNWGGGKVTSVKPSVDVTTLTGPDATAVTKQYDFTAAKKNMSVPDGSEKELWLFNGQLTGPAIRVTQGDVVEVTLTNKNIEDGITIHWHGYDVPNAEDGVPDISQKVVAVGESYTYRFTADTAGTFWYHSHNQSSEQVGHGLFGSFIVEPKKQVKEELEIVGFVAPKYVDSSGALLPANGKVPKNIKPGTNVRIRLGNAHNKPQKLILNGTTFQIAAIDGNLIHKPTDLKETYLQIPAGGRMDITFTMPNHAVCLFDAKDATGGWVFQSTGENTKASTEIPDNVFKPEKYGEKKATTLDASDGFDRLFTMVFDSKLAFFDGMVHHLWTINGELYPNTPMLMVNEGDLVKTTFVNRSYSHHPMHLHGHKMLVLTRNGAATTGSPWWTDTLNVKPGETYEVAFKADNPGIWMDHCHNLDHATNGMMMHLQYNNVYTPFSGHTHE
ncbi:multicopper oxidase domain-containing protein [Paenilisteria rocourtiae]|uniref:FtsP/CotA-like multicopper oxidase with cupredoxin domain n=2 Tax=Listeria rocourtiae TaxID=647910 RepID=A0A4R6ZNE8_9LIST|nr:multicopper oxidase domain-containing protein [Listeria rocourtiae]MBC1603669.1 multicopper oxidase domain-containing protein [Listeria rocourtiae]TDR54027.1 FtsP/CotA-like multicopper oxidase with cupredoxin domain [Listeria rocourtiae]